MNSINKVIQIAENEIGYLEKRSNSKLYDKTANAGNANYTKYWAEIKTEYQGQPWCACFVTWCFVKAFGKDKIAHGGNPVLRWMAGNVVVETDAAENIKPTKAKSTEKIDGIVAAIMALDRCVRNKNTQQGSVYDSRAMIVL